MTREELNARTDACIQATREALQVLWDSINKGQRKQLAKQSEIREILDRYGVDYSE